MKKTILIIAFLATTLLSSCGVAVDGYSVYDEVIIPPPTVVIQPRPYHPRHFHYVRPIPSHRHSYHQSNPFGLKPMKPIH